MAAAASRQTTTVAHSPSVISSDVVYEVWVVTLSFNLWRLFCGLNVFLCVFCRSPSGHPVAQCSLALGRFPLEVCAWRYHGCGCRSSGRSSVRSSRVGSRRSCVYRLPCESGALAGGGRGTRVPRAFLLCCCCSCCLGRSPSRRSFLCPWLVILM